MSEGFKMPQVFGHFVQKLQSLSPYVSPSTSPIASPKFKRRFGIRTTTRRRKLTKEDFRDVQSEPEGDFVGPPLTPIKKGRKFMSRKKRSTPDEDGRSKTIGRMQGNKAVSAKYSGL